MTRPAEAAGAAPGRGRLARRRVLVVGAAIVFISSAASLRAATGIPAYAAVWLLSGEASYVNAHPLVLDGGATSFG